MPKTLDALKDERKVIRTMLRKARQSGDKASATKYQEELTQINEAITTRENRS
ncbi:MAG: hypothetical protein ACXAB4_04635 [Candidatus Hodarchaeales archaeon]|jgi:hypothetical protein